MAFSKETVRFLAGLQAHNKKEWFEAHRADYDEHFVEPAKAFVEALAPKLARIDPEIHAEPRVNGSILRINRDVRFSKDKSPYKDHLDLWFWSGEEKGWECSGFFFRLTARELMLGAGMHGFAPPVLARYREAVLDDRKGAELVKAVAKVRKAGYQVGGQTYKKTPRGVAEDHPRSELLKHSGLYTSWSAKHPRELAGPALVPLAAKHYAAMAPIHHWLRSL
jgi:uncharacterized protein (TIGR02453 family)